MLSTCLSVTGFNIHFSADMGEINKILAKLLAQ